VFDRLSSYNFNLTDVAKSVFGFVDYKRCVLYLLSVELQLNPNTMCLQITLGEDHGSGHFYMAENRTFLLCVDTGANFVVSKAEEAYDARANGPNRKFQLTNLNGKRRKFQ
jgi:hypothetical protein